ncbi:MAG TPA: glycosyltransferase family 2 protein [Dehalococcoidia bacterium]|nr:glycosyltransferase family 2 protein [Dehalococcoidia bacterium]
MNDASIVILTKNAGGDFQDTLGAIFAQKYPGEFEVIIVDSGSTDHTLEIAQTHPTKIHQIKPEDFGHGRTRNLAASLAIGDYLVFLTQDAVPATDKWLSNLIRNLKDSKIAGVYGRQIPKKGTRPMESFFLNTRYPLSRMVKSAGQGKVDMNTIFFSNANSAFRKEIWGKYPFDDSLIMSEDQEWAKKVLLAGYEIVYDPEAAVYHSHNYSLKTAFQRYFDSGVSLNQFAGKEYGSFTSEGLAYTKNELKFLISNGYMKWLPYAILYDLAKFFGVSLGKREKYLPLGVKRRLSLYSYHWSGGG